jgi:hypothetical protein
MPRLEEIVYEAGLHALADQKSFVAGIRQRTGTLLAAHAIVASFLGAAVIRAHGLDVFGWIALSTLVLGLGVAAVLLAPWELQFSFDARDLYDGLYPQTSAEADAGTLDWLVAAGFGYQDLHEQNTDKVRSMSRLSGALGVLMIVQTLAWLTALVVA